MCGDYERAQHKVDTQCFFARYKLAIRFIFVSQNDVCAEIRLLKEYSRWLEIVTEFVLPVA
jgi:hypothetical protein